jgi:peptidoglycan/xylan/chitin deacetylase (PgdA/CDA1 family)
MNRFAPRLRVPSALSVALLALTIAGCGAAPTVATPSSAKKSGASSSAGSGVPTSAEQTAALVRFAAKHHPIFCGGHTKRWVAFTFDDGPGPYTKLAVQIMRHERQPATFFLVGRNVAPFESSLKDEQRIAPLGDHSWSHPLLTSLSAGEDKSQIVSTKQAIERASGKPVRLFRPPYGAHNAAVDDIARRNGLVQILWNVDSRDALGANHAQIAHNVLVGMHAGSIILMHENRGQTIRALKFKILPHLKHENFKLVTVPQMLAGNPPSDKQLSLGANGCR